MGAPQLLLGISAVCELANLATDGGHHVEEDLVESQRAAGEKFQHTKELFLIGDRKCHSTLQPATRGKVAPRKGWVEGQLADPHRLAACPNSPGQFGSRTDDQPLRRLHKTAQVR